MKQLLWCGLVLCGTAMAGNDDPVNYYDQNPPVIQPDRIPAAPPVYVPEKDRSVRGVVRIDVTGADNLEPVPPSMSVQDNSRLGVTTPGALPPNMERGVKDLEEGMEELRDYTGVMATHIQQNGLRGFLATPQDIRDQGTSVGRKIGSGINGIMTDTAVEMISPGQ